MVASDLHRLQDRVRLHLQRLLEQDPRLLPVSKLAGQVLPRTRPPGFAGLARIVCGQQLSVASADAIWARLEARNGSQTPQAFLDLMAAGLDGIGLSRGKAASLQAIAQAMTSGALDLDVVAALPADQAIAALTRHKGIGPWTAEIYLMFCTGHPDIFPAGDLALRKAVGGALHLASCTQGEIARMAAAWAPYRSTAALLFWRYYAVTRQRESLPL